ncbi:MAG: ATP-binding cassette domain-containing protein, partial [Geminicoccaceae bacterium]|nr:ATP-binding cassette domain-containing protein [Geminicoccaceae bacterium]
GGEQQMLAIGRALLTNPRLLVLDEATEGLAPAVRREIWQCIRALKATGIAILLVDPHLGRLLELTDTNVIIENGRSVWQGSSAELADRPELQRRYLAV